MGSMERSRGVVPTSSASNGGRQVFFQLTPELLEMLEETGTESCFAGSIFFDMDVEKYLGMLPTLEAEIVFLLYKKKKVQKDIAEILGVSQPTVSYRYRRALEKMAYLMLIETVDLSKVLEGIPNLKSYERAALGDLFRFANQELVGEKHDLRQSSVKWIFMKSRRYVEEQERNFPEKYFSQYIMLALLERNIRLRVYQ